MDQDTLYPPLTSIGMYTAKSTYVRAHMHTDMSSLQTPIQTHIQKLIEKSRPREVICYAVHMPISLI